jgi:hypothetical protein
MSKAKTMSRSRNQLATAYAPGSFFTFEGGLGACLACSSPGETIGQLSDSTNELIFERLNEVGRAWFAAAMTARENDQSKPQPIPSQCVDRALLDASMSTFQIPGRDRIHLCRPSFMEYTPAPLCFVCRTCGIFKDFDSLNSLDKALPTMEPEHCPNPKHRGDCDWEQLDVVFVHWSGRWEAPFPGQWNWNPTEEKVTKFRSRCTCGSVIFRLNRRAPGIGDWFFECAACDTPLSAKWLQNDRDTLEMFGAGMNAQRLTEVRMQATPYRASSTYYVKTDLFIDFKNNGQQLLACLRPNRIEELQAFVAAQYGFEVGKISDQDVEAICSDKPECVTLWADYQTATKNIPQLEAILLQLPAGQREAIQTSIDGAHRTRRSVIEQLRARQMLIPKVELPSSVREGLQQRQSRFASKFDPFRLGIEHATLKASRLDIETRTGGKRPYASFARLDEDLAPEDCDEARRQQETTRALLDRLGLDDMGLIREFDLCKFSYGYSRMEAGPVLRDKRGMDMPVRLNLFPTVRVDDVVKAPIYVIQQSNEAIYVRLKEDQVLRWLTSLGCDDMFQLREGERAGAGILSVAQPMGAFLDNLPRSEQPPIYFYLYSLLHSYSHLLMKHVAEYSGLDLGSLGEYIFPADLAFVVYRNGTTMDLGNLTAMWRNAGNAMLTTMLGPRATQCGTGTLCTHRGGACPDCIMVPETSCLASNKFLSRSVLNSVEGRPSRFDTRAGSIRGYLEFS